METTTTGSLRLYSTVSAIVLCFALAPFVHGQSIQGGSGSLPSQYVCPSSPSGTYNVNTSGVSGGSITGYDWSVGGGSFSGSHTGSNVTVNWTTGGTLTVQIFMNGQGFPSYSANLSVTVLGAPTVTISGPSLTCSANSTGSFTSSVVNGIGTLSYQWYRNYPTAISGETGPTLTNTPLSQGDQITLRVWSTGWCGSSPISSNVYTANITTSVTPTASATPSVTTICTGSQITFTASSAYANGSTTYAWTKSRVPGTIANGSTYAPTAHIDPNVSMYTFSPGDQVSVTISNLSGACLAPTTVVANAPTVTISYIPNAVASNKTICSGTLSGVGISTNSGATGVSFTWTVQSSSNVTGASASSGSSINQTLSSTNGTSDGTVTYRITPSNSACAGPTSDVTVTVNALPVVPSTNSVARCGTGTVLLTTTPGSGGTSLNWYSASTGGTLLQSNSINYTTPSISTTTIYYAETFDPTIGCKSATRAAVTATVNPFPAVPSTNSFARCGAGTVALTTTPGSGGTSLNWYSASIGGTLLQNNSTTYTTPSISATTIYYAETLNTTTGCLSATRSSVTVAVNDLPASPSNNTIGRCSTGTVALTTTPGSGGTSANWYNASTGGTLLQANSINYTTPIISTTTSYYAETLNTTTGCQSATRAAVTATVNSLPAVPTTNNIGRCSTGTVALTTAAGAGGASLNWYNASTAGTLLLGNSVNYTTPSISSTTIYYAETLNTTTGCQSATRAAVTATVNALPVVPSTNNIGRCSTGTVALTTAAGAGGASLNWYNASAGGTLLLGNSVNYTTPSISSTTIYYAETLNTTTGCESATRAAVTATVNSLPAVPNTNNIGRCSTGTVALTTAAGAGGASLNWYNASTSGTLLLGNSVNYTTPSISSTTIYYAETLNTTTGCQSATRAAVTATVNSLPAVPTTNNIGRCSTGTVALTTAAGAGGASLNWYNASTAGTLLLGNSVNYTTPSISSTTIYYAETLNTTTGCQSATRAAVTATVNALPVVPSTNNIGRCSTGTVALTTAAGAGGASLNWYNASAGGTLLLGNSVNYTTPSISSTTIYYAETLNTTTGCESATRAAVTATVNSLPAVPNTNNIGRCSTGTVALTTAAGAGGASLNWYNASTSGTLLLGNSVNYTTPSISSTTIYYAETLNTTTGCQSATRAAVTATVNPFPAAPTTNNIGRCSTGTVALTTTPGSGATSLNWYNASTAGTLLLGNSINYTTPSISTTTIYYAETLSSAGCQSSTRAAVTATVNSLPAVPTTNNIGRCSTGTVALTTTPGSGATSLNWYNASTAGTLLLGNSINYTTPSISTTTIYYAETLSSAGCQSSTRAAVTATVNSLPAVPTTNNVGRCSTGTVALTTTPGSGATSLNWYSAPTAGTLLLGNSINYTTPSISTTTIYYAETLTTTGCQSATRAAVTATVNPFPVVPGTNNIARCSTGTVALTTTPGSGGTSLNWYTASTAGTLLVGNSTTYTTPSISTTTIYYAETLNTTTGCQSATRAAVTATVNPVSVGGTVAPGSENYGVASGTLTSASHVGAIQKWQAKVGSGNWSDIASTATSLNYSNITNTTQYRVEVKSGACPVAYSTTPATITIFPVPQVTITGTTSLAPGGSVVFTATGGMFWYQWMKDNIDLTGQTASVLTITHPGTYKLKVKAASSNSPIYTTGDAVITYVFEHQMQDMNYVQTVNIQKAGVTSSIDLYDLQAKDFALSTTYFDGLGRPVQSVALGAGGNGSDLVQSNVYDKYGREPKKYLPYGESQRDGRYQPAALDHLTDFYESAIDVAHDTVPYSRTMFEASPLSRPLKDFGPGQAWAPSEGNKYVEHKYLINAHGTGAGQEKIINWIVDATGNPIRDLTLNGGYHTDGSLSIKSTLDEQGNEVREYTNTSGQVILKKVYATGTITDLNNVNNWASTYYIYDDFNQLRFVFQPELSKVLGPSTTLNPDSTALADFSFQYKYDARKRMISKRVPGAAEVLMVYDKRDRLVLSQDGNLRAQNQWLFTKYDILNRPVMTGIYPHGYFLDQAGMSALIDPSNFFETVNTGTMHGYTTSIFPSSNLNILTVTYYDNYTYVQAAWSGFTFVDEDLSEGGYNSPNSAWTRVMGQVTGTKVKVLDGGNTYLRSINYYDDRQRLIQVITDNYKGGWDRVSSLFDFAGKVLKTSLSHHIATSTRVVAVRKTYDANNRPVGTYHKVGASEILLSANEYNSIGQLKAKNLHGENGNFAQELDYEYNIRGWLTKINQPDVTQVVGDDDVRDYFGMELGYQSQLSGLTPDVMYNGNISAMKWAVLGKTDQSYEFEYDAMNRLMEATHFDRITGNQWTDNNGRFSEGALTYDLNGNIQTLKRKDVATTYMDNLSYHYSGNRLLYVGDTGDALKGFVDNNPGTDDYDYDVNGNLTKDKNKGIGAGNIRYNFLNLPRSVRKSGADSLVYMYDATGRKLRQQVYGTKSKITDYAGPFIYENDTLRFINHEEGRVLPDGSDWEYQYHLKDHLGNVRLTFTSKIDTEEKLATLESANVTGEVADFLRYANARRIYSIHFDRTNNAIPDTSPGYSQRLTGSANEKYGLARSLSVMPGDTVRAEVYGKYADPVSANRTQALNDLINQIVAGAAGVVFEGAGYLSSTSSFPFAGLQNTAGSTGGPKAYLNWLVFDRDFNFIDGGYDRMSAGPKETGQNVAHELMMSPDIIITEPGYVYIYLSNEELTPMEVYFDDLKVTLAQGPMVQMDDYYQFGLKFNSYSRENSVRNRYQYNGKENLIDLDLNWNDYGARMYMTELGRWAVVDPLAQLYYEDSPYSYVANNPINAYDIDGRRVIYVNGYFSRVVNFVSGMAPGAAGEQYWNFFDNSFISSSRQFMGAADSEGSVFIDGSSYFGGDQSGGDRYELGKQYAEAHYLELIQGMSKGETFKFVSHSEGGAFAAGMADYLKSKGLEIESMLYLSPDEADEFSHPLGIFSIQSHFENDIVSPSIRLDGVNVYMNSSTLHGGKISKMQAHGSTVSTSNLNKMKSILGRLSSDVMKLFGSAQWNVRETKTGYTFTPVDEKKENELEEYRNEQ